MKKIKNLIKNVFKIYKTKSLQKQYPLYKIGRGSYGIPQIVDRGEGSTLQIGAFCSIAPHVKIFLGSEHRTDWVTTYPFSVLWDAGKEIEGHPKTKGDVIIKNDVWIGTEAMIMSGVTVGDGAVIGARTIVTKDILPYEIAVGNPMVIIKKRFEENIIYQLLEIKWWEWEDHKIEKYLPLLLNDNITGFINVAKNNK